MIEVAGLTGLLLNEQKTKYMEKSTKFTRNYSDFLISDNFKFETINSFTHLDSIINASNTCSEKIDPRILKGNQCYFLYQHLLKTSQS